MAANQGLAQPAIVGGALVPVLGIGAVAPLVNGKATGAGPGVVIIFTDIPGAIPIVTPNSGATQFTSCSVLTNGTDTWTVNTARTDTNAPQSVILHVLFVIFPKLF
jgi:hypothetical protein